MPLKIFKFSDHKGTKTSGKPTSFKRKFLIFNIRQAIAEVLNLCNLTIPLLGFHRQGGPAGLRGQYQYNRKRQQRARSDSPLQTNSLRQPSNH